MLRKVWFPFALAAGLLACCGASAQASLQVQVVATPSVNTTCGTEHIFFSIANSSDNAECSLVKFDLSVNSSSTSFSTVICLPAGAHRSREASYFIPPQAPTGTYTITVTATSRDGSSSTSTTQWVVQPGGCVAPGGAQFDLQSQGQNIGSGLGLASPSAVRQTTWGAIHRIYR